MYVPPVTQARQGKSALVVGSLVLFIVGLITYLPYIVSLVLSFKIVRRNYVKGAQKAIVLTCAILELLAWLLCASMSWLYSLDCSNSYSTVSYDNATHSYYNDTEYYCYGEYWGWIFIVVWFAFGLMFGIVRVVLQWQYAECPLYSGCGSRGCAQPQAIPVSNPHAYIPLAAPVNHDGY